MCFGGGAKQPEIKYVAPDQSAIRAGEEALAKYEQETRMQQQAFQQNLQSEIDKANAQTADIQSSNAAETAAAAALAAAETSAYTTTATQGEIPEQAQTTKAVTEKKKPKKNLKISTAGTSSTPGSGVNVGI
jgi:hypothetical protein